MSSNNEDSEEIHSEESVEDPKRQCRNIGIDRVFLRKLFCRLHFFYFPPSFFFLKCHVQNGLVLLGPASSL